VLIRPPPKTTAMPKLGDPGKRAIFVLSSMRHLLAFYLAKGCRFGRKSTSVN
jgi:hypothetical protein